MAACQVEESMWVYISVVRMDSCPSISWTIQYILLISCRPIR